MAMSPEFIEAIMSPQTDELILPLVEISHEDMESVERYVADDAEIISGGETFSPGGFTITLPEEGDDASPTLGWEMENLNSEFSNRIRGVTGFAEVTIRYVLASSPDTIEMGPMTMELQNVTYDRMTIGGTLGIEPVLDSAGCIIKMVPSLFPGLF